MSAKTAGTALLITSDYSFAGELKGILESDHQLEMEHVESFSDAAGCLEWRLRKVIFVDLCQTKLSEDASGFIEFLSKGSGRRVPVIGMVGVGYPREWTAVADLVVDAHVFLPLDRAKLARLMARIRWPESLLPPLVQAKPARLMESEFPRAKREASANPRVSKVVQGRSVTSRTYSPAMAELLDHVVMMAPHNVTLLLVGETGTGKTTLAKLIHELSPRREGPLLTIACGALSPELVESELFGHVRGAFTSADRTKTGKLEAAQSGTLLLDEIDAFNAAQQVKLLRVIETGEFEPVGSNETRSCRARLIVASNVDLKDLVARNAFRADLYYRLNVLEFHLPPLRERASDIGPLALAFVEEMCQTYGVTVRRVHPEFLDCLKAYDWPGNIRELKNYVRRAVLFCRTQELTPKDVLPYMAATQQRKAQPCEVRQSPDSRSDDSLNHRVAASEKAMLEEALRKNGNNRTVTARDLGLSRAGLYKKMRRYALLAEP